MGRQYHFLAYFLLLFVFLSSSIAGPWYTGPLLAPAGITIPKGHVNVEIYGFDVRNIGRYNGNWQLIHLPASNSYQMNPLLSFGLADRMDVQISTPYIMNEFRGLHTHHIGDVMVLMGFQAMRQGDNKWKPNLRITISESFPTGRYSNFDPDLQGIDGSGTGSYDTAIGFNFQHLHQFNDINYLRTRLDFSFLYPSNVPVSGFNAYGGDRTTRGHVQPGNLFSADLAGELTITKHWVAVMEAYYFNRARTTFDGFPGLPIQGLAPQLGNPYSATISLAPAVEYNFNEHIGIIGGTWFSIRGKNAGAFRTLAVAINAYW